MKHARCTCGLHRHQAERLLDEYDLPWELHDDLLERYDRSIDYGWPHYRAMWLIRWAARGVSHVLTTRDVCDRVPVVGNLAGRAVAVLMVAGYIVVILLAFVGRWLVGKW